MPVRNSIAQMQDQIAAWRRDIHAHPEQRFQEHRTGALVAEKLRGFGCDEVVPGIGKTGVVGVIHGKTNVSGRVIGLRADMDALPITEMTGLDHASTTPGTMHACGHDGHTAMLLGAAHYLAGARNFDGTVVLMFQPAEEGSGGARAMIEDGMMDRWGIQEVYGMHNWPGLPVGQFAVRTGPQMAAADGFEIVVRGRGGHAAIPHETIDTTLAAAHLVVALQSVVARNVDPLKTAVLSVCSHHSDSEAFNVIPDKVVLKGTVRYLDPEVQVLVEARLRAVVHSTAQAYGASAEVRYWRGVLPTVNAPDQADFAAEAAEAVAGSVRRDLAPTMAGEDFSDMLAERPGAFIFVGNGDSADLHHPEYEFNDATIPAGSSWFVEMVERRMPAV
jgi:hippurate hydrolase